VIDSKDKILLYELTKKCRTPYSYLANLCNISVEEVHYRLNRLVKDRIIQKFTVVPSISLFNAKDAIILFRSNNQLLDFDRITLIGVNPALEYISTGNFTEGFAFLHYRTFRELDEVVNYFYQFNFFSTDIQVYTVEPLLEKSKKQPKTDLLGFEKIDWLILAHLREQGRLPLNELSVRTNIAVETLVKRLEFLRDKNLIDETIQINFSKTQKENWTIFCVEMTILTQPLLKEMLHELESLPNYWKPSCWRVIDQNIIILGFLCSSYTDVEKIQSWISDIPGIKSIEKVMGGSTYYFPDFRDELIEERKSHGWFSPEQWVIDKRD
jgi:DNA-binding Lrp family transcriptional regulator